MSKATRLITFLHSTVRLAYHTRIVLARGLSEGPRLLLIVYKRQSVANYNTSETKAELNLSYSIDTANLRWIK